MEPGANLIYLAVVAAGAVLLACSSSSREPAPAPTRMTVTSPAFLHGQPVPKKHTADGDNLSPPLAILNVPPEGLSAHRKGIRPKDLLEGRNSWGNTGYEGPEPPPGKPHRYFFTLYALTAPLDVKAGLDKKALLKAMEGKIIAQAQWMGTYQR